MKFTPGIVLGLLGILVANGALAADADNPHLGTWKLNETKSNFRTGATKNRTVTYTGVGGGKVKLEVEGVDGEGKTIRWSWQGSFDGKAEKVSGSSGFDMLSIKMTGARTLSNTSTKDGKVVSQTGVEVANDGKSRRVTNTRTDRSGRKVIETSVYDKL